jgi:hypothetical protein
LRNGTGLALHVDASDGDAAAPVTAESGVKSIDLFVDGGLAYVTQGGTAGRGTVQQGCDNGGSGSCPMSADFVLDPDHLQAGPHTFKVVTTDQVGNQDRRSFTPGDDSVGPTLSASGSLLANGPVPAQTQLRAQVSDAQSGATSVQVYLDGELANNFEQSCLAGGCSMDHTFDFDLSDRTGGKHLVKVVAQDVTGNKTRQKRTIDLDPTPPSLAILGSIDSWEAAYESHTLTTAYFDAQVNADDGSARGTSGVKSIRVARMRPDGTISYSNPGWTTDVDDFPMNCASGCPRVGSTTYQSAIDIMTLSDAPIYLIFTAYDAAGNSTTKVKPVQVSPLRIGNAGGTLFDRIQDYGPIFGDEAPSMRLIAAGGANGARELKVMVDGVTRSDWIQTCSPTGYCPLDKTYTFSPAGLTTGNHHITAIAYGFNGEVTQQDWDVSLDNVNTYVADQVSGDRDTRVRLATRDQMTATDASAYLPCTGGQQPANFDLATAGSAADGLGLNHVTRRCDAPDPDQDKVMAKTRSASDPPPDPVSDAADARANYVSYIYGNCQLPNTEDPACAAPIEVQVWPICERTLASYQIAPGESYPRIELPPIHGVPTFSFDGGTRIEMYTGDATVVIFGDDPDQVQDVAREIQLAPSPTTPDQAPDESTGQLPPPEAGGLDGSANC